MNVNGVLTYWTGFVMENVCLLVKKKKKLDIFLRGFAVYLFYFVFHFERLVTEAANIIRGNFDQYNDAKK